MTRNRRQLIRKFPDEIVKGNIDFVGEVYAQNCSICDPALPAHGVSEMKERMRLIRSFFPNIHIEVHEIVVDGDMTATRWTLGGTNTGEVAGLPATGTSFAATAIILSKWEGARIVEEWSSYSTADILRQLGLTADQARSTQTRLAEMTSKRVTR